ncbi:MAG TPA: hypothetical protein VF885_03735 [Arthrobacter sp.]
MTDTIVRHPKGTAGAGRFAAHTSPESPISLTDIAWARKVTGTTDASDPRYDEVMSRVFAAASTSVDPGWTPPVVPTIPSAAVFDVPVPAMVDGDGGRVSGGPDDLGMYAFTEQGSCEPYRLHLHHLSFTDPDSQPGTEQYAAALAFIAAENRRDVICRFFRSRASSAEDGADAADALLASVDRTSPQPPGVVASLDDLEDATREVVSARGAGMDRYSETMTRLNEKAMRAGQALATHLGYVQAPELDD